jgi:diacylglycerol kinase
MNFSKAFKAVLPDIYRRIWGSITTAQSSGRREIFTLLEVEKTLFTAAELMTSTILSSAMPDYSTDGVIDLWEIETKFSQILTETINSVTEVAPLLGGELSSGVKKRQSILISGLVNSFIECVVDAFGSTIEIERTTPRIISVRLSREVKKKDFIEKEFKSTAYDALRYLLGR